MNWAAYFEMMADWKRLPAYKAEPRIDSLVGYYLPDFMTDFLSDKIVGIIPELPIRIGTVKPQYNQENFADRSYKVDFYLLGMSGIHYLVEFKTDSGSRRDKQDTYLSEARDLGMKAVVEGVLRIASVSTYKAKYNHLLSKMTSLGILDSSKMFSGKSDEVKVIYVQPCASKEGDVCVDFEWIAKWLSEKYGDKEFERELAKALSGWARD